MQTTGQASRAAWWLCLLLATVTALAYWRTIQNGFIIYDDPDYVTSNAVVQAGLTWKGMLWAFTTTRAGNWHPLTWLSHMLDCQLYGLHPAGHHLTNLLLHILNTLLLFQLLRRLTAALWASAFVALLFALHPLHVESVAWVAERKDVLSAAFFFLTLLAYTRYAEATVQEAEGQRQQWGWYSLALVFFALGLLSKPMLVTLPCVLLLLDYWPLKRGSSFPSSAPALLQRTDKWQVASGPTADARRPSLTRLIVEKAPFFALAALSCWITIVAQSRGKAVMPDTFYPLEDRLANVPVAYAWYLLKLFWPANLTNPCPLVLSRPEWMIVAASLLVAGLTLLAIKQARRRPCLFVGWLWFAGMLAPVSGIIQVGNQAYADRYTYLPYIGLFIIFAWTVPELLGSWRFRPAALVTGAVLASVACLLITAPQVRFWKDTQTLFERAVAVNPGNSIAWYGLGLLWANQGQLDRAAECYQRAGTGGDLSFHGIKNNLGLVFLAQHKFPEAEAAFRDALRLAPNKADLHGNLAIALTGCGRIDEAMLEYGICLSLDPNHLTSNCNLADLQLARGQHAEAIAHYRQALTLDTNCVTALNNLAWLLATHPDPGLRDGAEAVCLAERACDLTQHQEPLLVGTLAAAYAEAGRFPEAMATARKARDLALAAGQQELADKNEQLLGLYKAGKAYHQDPPEKR